MGEFTLWEVKEGVGVLTLNRPEKHNSLNDGLIEEIGDTIESCAEDESVRVLVLKGAGKSFCSGGDLKDNRFLTTDSDLEKERCLRTLHRIPLGLRKLPQPVIGALSGVVGGGGLDLAMGCDIRIASEDARFGSLFARIGLMPDGGGTYHLPRLLGTSKALEMLLSGDLIDAREAHRIGLVNRVVEPQELEGEVLSFAGQLANGPFQSMRLTKQIVYQNLACSLENALEQEIFGQIFLSGTEDAQEGIKAFAEGRKPGFKGC